MKCAHCDKEINEMVEKYTLLTLDGDFIHDNCIDEYYQCIEDNIIADLIDEFDEIDDGTRYTWEEVIELAKSLIGNEDIKKQLEEKTDEE